MRPSVVGYCSKAPHKSAASKLISPTLPTCRSIFSGLARALTTAIVCGWQSTVTKNPFFLPRAMRWHIVIASAAAVASSSSEAFANGSPVRSATMV